MLSINGLLLCGCVWMCLGVFDKFEECLTVGQPAFSILLKLSCHSTKIHQLRPGGGVQRVVKNPKTPTRHRPSYLVHRDKELVKIEPMVSTSIISIPTHTYQIYQSSNIRAR